MDATDHRSVVTARTALSAARAAKEAGIGFIVLASNTGQTALAALEAVKGEFGGAVAPKLVCVTHMVGYAGDGIDEMTAEMRERLLREDVAVLTTTHLFGGVERSMTALWKGVYPLSMVANALKLFGQGAKVAVEVAVMALDSGMIPHGVDVISLGGTGRGADTCLLIRPAHSLRFFDTKVKRVIALAE